jgi:hypothetical protein
MAQVKEDKANGMANEISIKELVVKTQAWWRFVLSKWKVILIAAAIGGVIGLITSFVKKPVYKAELSFALQDEKTGGLSSALGLASQFGIDLGGAGAGGEFSGDNLLGLMKSRAMVQKTLLTAIPVNGKNETLAELYISFNNLRDKWSGEAGLENIHFLPGADVSGFTLKQDSVLGLMHKELTRDNLVVDKLDKKLSIITLSVNSKNELFSKYFTEVLAKVVSDFYIQTKTEKASKNVAILQKQVDSVRRDLNSAISGVASSMDAAPNSNPLLQSLHVPSQRKQVDVTANTAILSELVKNLEVSKMSLLQETPLIQVIDRPILPLEKERIGKIKGIVVGCFLGAFLLIVGLSLKKFFTDLLE